MTISARIIADSVYGEGDELGPRLTTFVLRYPRFIHAEFMTHRVFSRNSASSRAIPIQKMIDDIIADPATPIHWGKAQSGMQAYEELSSVPQLNTDPMASNEERSSPRFNAKVEWARARDFAVMQARRLMKIGAAKQLVNRVLEPYAHVEVVVTATDWANFYALRNHAMAQPEIKALAEAMLVAHRASTPIHLKPGEWHLPFITDTERKFFAEKSPEDLAKISAARCARVSYLKHDGTPASYDDDLKLYDRLMGGSPKHASPCEHQARPPTEEELFNYFQLTFSSNLRCWVQFRKTIEGEYTRNYEEFWG